MTGLTRLQARWMASTPDINRLAGTTPIQAHCNWAAGRFLYLVSNLQQVQSRKAWVPLPRLWNWRSQSSALLLQSPGRSRRCIAGSYALGCATAGAIQRAMAPRPTHDGAACKSIAEIVKAHIFDTCLSANLIPKRYGSLSLLPRDEVLARLK